MPVGATGFEPIVMWMIKSLFQRRVIIRIASIYKVDRSNYNDKHHDGNIDGMGTEISDLEMDGWEPLQ